jgi:hypothetical protein
MTPRAQQLSAIGAGTACHSSHALASMKTGNAPRSSGKRDARADEIWKAR